MFPRTRVRWKCLSSSGKWCVIIMASEKNHLWALPDSVSLRTAERWITQEEREKNPKGSKLGKFYRGIHHTHCWSCNYGWWKVATKGSLRKLSSPEWTECLSAGQGVGFSPRPNVGPPALGRAEYGPGALPSHPLSFLHLILSDHSDISTALLQLTSILFVFALMWKENRFRNLKNCLLSSDQLGLGCQSVSFAQVGRSKRHPKMWTLFLGCHSAL